MSLPDAGYGYLCRRFRRMVRAEVVFTGMCNERELRNRSVHRGGAGG